MFSVLITALILALGPVHAEDRPVLLEKGGLIYAESRGWFGSSVLLRCRLDPNDHYGFGGTAIGRDEGMTIVKIDHLPPGCGETFVNSVRNEKQVFVEDKYVKDFDALTEAGLGCEGLCRGSSHKGGLGHIDPSALGLGQSKFVNRPQPQKTQAELDRYVDCHMGSAKGDYARFKALIRLAGDVFQVSYDPKAASPAQPILNAAAYQNRDNVPFMLKVDPKALACVAMRESRFDPRQVSPTGGKGLFQQVNGNVREVNCLLDGCDDRPPSAWAKPLWNKFFETARRRKDYAALMINPVTKKPCGTSMIEKDQDAVCPVNSTAAAAVNYMNALLSFKRNSDLFKNSKLQDYGEDDRLILTILASSTNNAGIGSLGQAIRAGQSPSHWLTHLGETQKDRDRRKEVTDFMRFMKNCLQHGNAKSVWDAKPNSPEKDCRPQVASAAEE